EPAIPGDVPARPGCVDQLWGEPLYPPVDRDVVHRDAAFCQELFHIAVGQAVAQVPAQRQDDHFGREPEPGEAGPRSWNSSRTVRHQLSLPEPASVNATEPLALRRKCESQPLTTACHEKRRGSEMSEAH